jgi:hypothetical protein
MRLANYKLFLVKWSYVEKSVITQTYALVKPHDSNIHHV